MEDAATVGLGSVGHECTKAHCVVLNKRWNLLLNMHNMFEPLENNYCCCIKVVFLIHYNSKKKQNVLYICLCLCSSEKDEKSVWFSSINKNEPLRKCLCTHFWKGSLSRCEHTVTVYGMEEVVVLRSEDGKTATVTKALLRCVCVSIDACVCMCVNVVEEVKGGRRWRSSRHLVCNFRSAFLPLRPLCTSLFVLSPPGYSPLLQLHHSS